MPTKKHPRCECFFVGWGIRTSNALRLRTLLLAVARNMGFCRLRDLNPFVHANKKTPALRVLFCWLGNRDSNPNRQSQSLQCYLYTIPHRYWLQRYYTHFRSRVNKNFAFSKVFMFIYPVCLLGEKLIFNFLHCTPYFHIVHVIRSHVVMRSKHCFRNFERNNNLFGHG